MGAKEIKIMGSGDKKMDQSTISRRSGARWLELLQA
jgi:hypothetical protein